MSKKNRPLRIFIAIALAAVIPFVFVVSSLAFLPDAYGDSTFLAELADKYKLLKETNDKKIVIVGGSSVAFGINSETIEKATGYKVVNFGLYATLGTKMMLDLSRANINEGDIIILAPELNEQTMSLYFNATSAWQALEKDYTMLFHLESDCYDELAGGLFSFLSTKYKQAFSGKPIEQTGAYCHSSFNGYGDIIYPREYNMMKRGYDRNQTITLSSSIVHDDFVAYVNDYIDFASDNGASVYFSYCPMNSSAMDEETTKESVSEFVEYLEGAFDCKVIGDPWDSIMDSGYFYDTNFHLNDAGVTVHTQILTNDILELLGRENEKLTDDLPVAPGAKPSESGSSAQNP